MNLNQHETLAADIAQCMYLSTSHITEDFYLDMVRSEVVSVHFFHRWLFSESRESGSLLQPRLDGEWTKGMRAITEMQQNPNQYARIPRVKSSERRALLLELIEDSAQGKVRMQLLALVGKMESTSLGYDFDAFLNATEDDELRERFEKQIRYFLLKKALIWLTGLQLIAEPSFQFTYN